MRLQYTPHGEPGRDTAVRRRLAAERSADNSVQHSREDRPHGRLESEATRGHACHRQTTLTRSLNLLERDRVIERVAHPDGRIKAMRLTSKGRRALEVARPLWTQAQAQVLREVGTKSWADAQRRLAYLFHVAVERQGPRPGRRRGRLGREPRRRPAIEMRREAQGHP